MFASCLLFPGILSGWMNWQQNKGTAVLRTWKVDAQKDDSALKANRSNPFSHYFFQFSWFVPPWEAVYSFFVAVFRAMELEKTEMKNVLSSWF